MNYLKKLFFWLFSNTFERSLHKEMKKIEENQNQKCRYKITSHEEKVALSVEDHELKKEFEKFLKDKHQDENLNIKCIK